MRDITVCPSTLKCGPMCEIIALSAPRSPESRVTMRPDRLLTAQASHGPNQACVEMALEGVPECCSGAQSRTER